MTYAQTLLHSNTYHQQCNCQSVQFQVQLALLSHHNLYSMNILLNLLFIAFILSQQTHWHFRWHFSYVYCITNHATNLPLRLPMLSKQICSYYQVSRIHTTSTMATRSTGSSKVPFLQLTKCISTRSTSHKLEGKSYQIWRKFCWKFSI